MTNTMRSAWGKCSSTRSRRACANSMAVRRAVTGDLAPAQVGGTGQEQIGGCRGAAYSLSSRPPGRAQPAAAVRGALRSLPALVETDQGSRRIGRPGIDGQHVLHGGDEGGIAAGRDHPPLGATAGDRFFERGAHRFAAEGGTPPAPPPAWPASARSSAPGPSGAGVQARAIRRASWSAASLGGGRGWGVPARPPQTHPGRVAHAGHGAGTAPHRSATCRSERADRPGGIDCQEDTGMARGQRWGLATGPGGARFGALRRESGKMTYCLRTSQAPHAIAGTDPSASHHLHELVNIAMSMY